MKKVGIIGMGKMGSAIHANIKKQFTVHTFDKDKDLKQICDTDIIIFAVKPQSFYPLAKKFKKYLSDQHIISIMAGVGIRQMSNALGTDNITRTMPNISARYGKSITAVYPEIKNENVLAIVTYWGELFYLKDEDQFHSFTAVSSSSPAYFLKLADEIYKIARKNGFDDDIAKKIVTNSISAAAMLMEKHRGLATKGIDEIKSKRGVTEQALTALNDRFEKLIEESVNSAVIRSKEISDETK